MKLLPKKKKGKRKSKHKIVLSNEKLMCRSSTDLLFVFICFFSACKIQASIYALLVFFLYLKLHFIFALYLFIGIFVRIFTLLTFWAQACNMFSVRQVCVCLVFAWVLKNEFPLFQGGFLVFSSKAHAEL